ncbi:hypothetical protein XaplCFBP3123_17655 [Xanthomonas arboricola pv. populi]|nr:hypothetical protein XaplCFBP3123_17655 [Xanthomonas arboricola pv. populi]
MHECIKQLACVRIADRGCLTFVVLSARAVRVVRRRQVSLVQVCNRSEHRIGQHSNQQHSHGWDTEQATKLAEHAVHIARTIRVIPRVTQSQSSDAYIVD